MTTLLLSIIYMAFISLGLPDGLLGAAWPVMQDDVAAPLSAAGILSVIITVGTIVSSLLSARLTHRFGAAVVTAVSVVTTAAALVGFAMSAAFWQLCLWALPYGLGAGAVDAALNNVVALHCKARHMSWLHAFWGIGASIGPYIMAACLSSSFGWRGGYGTVAILQIALSVLLFCSIPRFRRLRTEEHDSEQSAPIGTRAAWRIPGVKAVAVAFFSYCAAEMTLMLWTSSYLTEYRRMDTTKAATFASLFYLGMMVGRLISGFLTVKFSDRALIRIGAIIALGGTIVVMMPIASQPVVIAGLIIIGLGCAPIYPSIIHSTPARFGAERSGAIIGIEMAGAYAGSCTMPPVFGLLAEHVSSGLFPFFAAAFLLLMSGMMMVVDRRAPMQHP